METGTVVKFNKHGLHLGYIDQEYIVTKVLGDRIRDGKLAYLVELNKEFEKGSEPVVDSMYLEEVGQSDVLFDSNSTILNINDYCVRLQQGFKSKSKVHFCKVIGFKNDKVKVKYLDGTTSYILPYNLTVIDFEELKRI